MNKEACPTDYYPMFNLTWYGTVEGCVVGNQVWTKANYDSIKPPYDCTPIPANPPVL